MKITYCLIGVLLSCRLQLVFDLCFNPPLLSHYKENKANHLIIQPD